jgi:outer membrane lipoprotein SlyB
MSKSKAKIMSETSRSTHPAIIVAAVAVTVASLAAAASFTGLLPARAVSEPALAANAEPAISEPAPPAAKPSPAPVPKAQHFDPPPPPRVNKSQHAVRDNPQPTGDLRYASERSTTNYASQGNDAGIDVIPARPDYAPPTVCRDCGTVEAIRDVSAPAEASGLGAVAGGVVGGLLGNQVGRGKGNTAATIVGAVGGAFAGHQTEKYVRADKQSQVTVRFEDGSSRSFSQEGGNRWQVGDRVRLSNGSLLPN